MKPIYNVTEVKKTESRTCGWRQFEIAFLNTATTAYLAENRYGT